MVFPLQPADTSVKISISLKTQVILPTFPESLIEKRSRFSQVWKNIVRIKLLGDLSFSYETVKSNICAIFFLDMCKIVISKMILVLFWQHICWLQFPLKARGCESFDVFDVV